MCHSCSTYSISIILVLAFFIAENKVLAQDNGIVPPEDGRVTKMSPRRGSLAGGTKLVIEGKGFSADQFSFDDPTLGNKVTLVSERGVVIPCSVIETDTSPTRISCETGAPPKGYEGDKYILNIKVNDKPLGGDNLNRYCWGSCRFYFNKWLTPTITQMSFQAGLSDQVIKISGRVLTAQVGRLSDGTGDNFNPEGKEITRIYIGGSNCDTNNKETEEAYGTWVDEWKANGYMICRSELKEPGSYRVSYLVSGEGGRSKPSDEITYVDASETIYQYQAHADVTSVSPKSGSVGGGTILRITGRFFVMDKERVTVTVGGAPCEVLSSSKTTIKCRTSQEPANIKDMDLHPGARGIVREIWKDRLIHDLEDVDSSLSSNTTGYIREHYTDFASSPTVETFTKDQERDQYTSRMKGFFVPPASDSYRFYVRSDDKSLVYFSNTTSPANKREIAGAESYTAWSWSKYASQRSEIFHLKGGQAYYFEVLQNDYGGGHWVDFGLHKHTTKLNHDKVPMAVDEVQDVKISTKQADERQTITVNQWTDEQTVHEEQLVTVKQCQMVNNTCNKAPDFKLSYDGYTSTSLSSDIAASALQNALNNLPSVSKAGSVTVSLESSDATTRIYRVTFVFNKPEDTASLEDASDFRGFVSVKLDKAGMRTTQGFSISIDGVRSQPIHADNTQEEMTEVVNELFTTVCDFSTRFGNGYFYQSFEGDSWGSESGDRLKNVEPYCGRKVLYNPDKIFEEDKTYIRKGGKGQKFDVQTFPQLCLAINGDLDSVNLRFKIRYTDKSNKHQTKNIYHTVESYTPHVWNHICVNMYDLVSANSELSSARKAGSSVYIKVISISRPLYVDDIWIGRVPLTVTKMRKAAQPNGHWIPKVSVTKKSSREFTINMSPARCGDNLPLFNVLGAQGNGSKDDKSFNFPEFVSDIRIQREQAASPPLTGVFDLSQLDKTVKDIPLNTTEEEFQNIVQENFNTGTVVVKKDEKCYYSRWKVTWTSKAGMQPLLHVNTSKLSGNKVYFKNTQTEGGLFYNKIPGEFLRMPTDSPQVVVTMNDLAASCLSEDCSYSYSTDRTPTIQSISPSRATPGTLVTITGTGFSSNSSHVMVTIGNVNCNITSANETQITFTVAAKVEPGVQSVNVNIAGKGNAVVSSGQNRRRGALDPNTISIEMAVSEVDPSSGGTAGGTTLTITGSGFGTSNTDLNVHVGEVECEVESVIPNEIKCKTGPHVAGTVDIVVSANGASATLNQLYTYDSALEARITGFSPTSGPVYGGSILTISGTGFPTAKEEIEVMVGGKNCDVQTATATQITCSLPRNPPGQAKVVVDTLKNSRASYNGQETNFTYALTVSNVSPQRGSLHGGTKVTITGEGFHSNMSGNAVKFGQKRCVVFESTSSEIKCRTENGGNIVQVDNSGSHQEYGIGYKWHPATVHIKVGDSVKWSWAAPVGVKLDYGVFQTADEQSSTYDSKGFNSPRSSSGSFVHLFTRPGTYYFSSGYIDAYGAIDMKGKVVVEAAASKIENVNVEVNGFQAIHRLPINASAKMEEAECQNSISTRDNVHYSFTFSTCVTAMVTMVTPSFGVSSDVITIEGSDFSITNENNTVKFGSHGCRVISSTKKTITCKLDMSESPAPFEPLDVSVHVKGLGNAIDAPATNHTTTFQLIPSVESITPKRGSMAGGTKVNITGQGFIGGMSVMIGDARCNVIQLSFTQITCITSTNENTEKLNQTVVLSLMKNNEQRTGICKDSDRCMFDFMDSQTPEVTGVQPSTITLPNTVITLNGSKFTNEVSHAMVTVGNESCVVETASETQITCTLAGLMAGTHSMEVNIKGDKGNSLFTSSGDITSEAALTTISPTQGSVNGGLFLTINGNGFGTLDSTSVTIGQVPCEITDITISVIKCKTGSQSEGSYSVSVTSGAESFPTKTFTTNLASTPLINSVTPNAGKAGESINVQGSGFSTDSSQNLVKIGMTDCKVTASTGTSITCTLKSKAAGTYPVSLHVTGKGYATSSTDFTYQLNIDSVDPPESGFGGGKLLTITGSGFDGMVNVTICGNQCGISEHHNVTDAMIQCETPAKSQSAPGADDACDVIVEVTSMNPDNTQQTVQKTEPSAYTYKDTLTSTITGVSPPRGGTGGGVRLTITGSGFSSTQSQNKVTIDGTKCTVISATTTEIQCTTGPHNRTIRTKVRVEVGTNGAAVQENADFYYVNVWSSRYSWNGRDPPEEGSFVVIEKGQTMVLDMDTPVLGFLLIKGGTFMFDDEKDIHLQSKFILITHGGSFMVGTEEKPFQHKATITIHGHVRSKEIPVYGAKSIALREGYLGLHGKHVLHTWTVITETVNPGDTSLKLKDAVTWQPGDKIVIAPTGKNIREHEEVMIVGVQQGGKVIQVHPPLEYKHISLVQTIAGRTIETRAEVGLLTRNVVVQGSQHDQWKGVINACPKNFEPGQFQTQTCFLGKFGQEPASDEFGVQIMIHAPKKSSEMVRAQFNHAEIRHAGQAFRIGRYPIHFHVSGDVDGSYVKGCSIHHSFNRAVTMHGINNLVVERNVFYHARGNAFFMEDGIETGNIIQYNLGIFVISSTSTLNVDVTPASYWVTNANNTVRHNVAAGGSHFGFWYQMFEHPDGPSFTPDVCPRNVFMHEFRNNTAHSFGRYGLWVFPIYHPKTEGTCKSVIADPAEFHSLLAYNNMRGAEGVQMGAVRFVDFIMMDNDLAGIEYIDASSDDAPWGGPMIKDSLIVGHSKVSEGLPREISTNRNCTASGLMLPKSSKLTVSNVTFVNFDRDQCVALEACAHCKIFQGGWTVKFEKIQFINSPRRSRFKWKHEVVFKDLDGTLSGTPGGSIVPTNLNLPSDACSESSDDSFGAVPGSTCDATVDFRRFSFNEARPESLIPLDAMLENEHGTDAIPWKFKGITHPEGWTCTLIVGSDYKMSFRNLTQVTNITYSGTFYEFNTTDYVRITHVLKQEPDYFVTTGHLQNFSETAPPTTGYHGEWGFVNETKEFTYLVTGKDNTKDANKNLNTMSISLRVYRCFFLKCVVPTPPPPTEGRPEIFLRWSQAEDWSTQEQGYGGFGGVLPKDDENVLIRTDWWMVADHVFPRLNRLIIHGVLELENDRDHVLNASIIFIMGDRARMIVGWKDKPHPGNVLISLQGNWDSPDMPLNYGPNVGSKAIGVFGSLEMHGTPRDVYWTRLNKTAEAGATVLELEHMVDGDWKQGDEIVIASTTFEARQAERMTIDSVSGNKITLKTALQYKHIAHLESLPDGRQYKMAAEVGLLTRNVKIEGSNTPKGSIPDQDFGCRVIVSKTMANGFEYVGKAKIENVEFKNCGQSGWTDSYDPRYSLAFLDIKTTTTNDSYVKGNSFNYNFNTALGVFTTNNLLVENNVIYFTLGASMRIEGEMNQVIRNLVIYSASLATYKGREDRFDPHWPGAIDTEEAQSVVLIDNAVGGSERVGYLTDGEPCDTPANSPNRWRGNTVHGALHGISIFYSQGVPRCAKISGFTVWKNYDWGLFFYTKSRVIVSDSVFADNTNSINPHVYAPPALTHVTADKFVHVLNTTFIGRTASWDCNNDKVVPKGSVVNKHQRALKSPSGGLIGMMMTGFMSGRAGGPKMRWDGPHNYPAIYGITKLIDVTFARFGEACGTRDVGIMTNPVIGDIMHPFTIEKIKKYSVDQASLVFYTKPTLRWVNPSDCVDMDCDGRRQLLITDIDGTFSGGKAGDTIISKAEFEWDGNPSFGLGDYRIPKAAQTNPDGSRIDISTYLPNKGIIRRDNKCTWNENWDAYKCSDMDYHMAIIESLDADTETRRLSPVAILGDGYINLLNGPQDHGWCLGYTCQERISTFYGIVASQRNYSVYFTNTNPQKMRLHLLADKEKVIRFAIYYTTTQRLDIYRKGLYINPTNAKLSGEDFTLKRKDPNLPNDQFEPQLSSFSGANYWDRDTNLLYVVVRGSEPIDIRTSPVIQVKLGMKPISVDEFFEENLVENLAALLGIDKSMIRVMNVISAGGAARRRRAVDSMFVEVEISDPPAPSIEYAEEDLYDNSTLTNATAGVPSNYTGLSNTTSFEELEMIASELVNQVQTGGLDESLNISVQSFAMTEPVPEPVDPTGGVRATNQTVQASNSTGNGTLRYDQINDISDDERQETLYDIPTQLVIIKQPSDASEGAVMSTQPKLRMRDADNNFLNDVGYRDIGAWVVMATIRQGTGHPGANITGNNTAKFQKGWANFTELGISHSGSGYIIDFHISYPDSANFRTSSQSIDIAERKVRFVISRQPDDGSEGTALLQQPQIEVRDEANDEIVNTGWQGRRWYATATLIDANNDGAMLGGDTTIEFVEGVATFTDLSIDISGSGYQLSIQTSTEPVSGHTDTLVTKKFDVEYNSGNLNTNPVFSNSFSRITLPEDASPNTLVTKANATDSDAGLNGVLTFSISSGDSDGVFAIDSATGEIRIEKTPDLETTQRTSYALTIEVKDKGNPSKSASQVLNIDITTVNEFAPMVSGVLNQTAREDSAVLTVIGKVKATDTDFGEDGKLTYSIVSGNDERCFEINATTGTVILVKKLDYIKTRDYDLGVKIEDNAPSDQRRSLTVTFHVDVTFQPRNTLDPEVKKVIELTFPDVDYDTVILGNEASFIDALKDTLVEKSPGVIFVHFELRKGSVIATFDMITPSSNVTNAVDQLASQVTSSGGLAVSFNGEVYTSNKMKADNEIYETVAEDDSSSIVVPVAVGSVLGAVLIFVVVAVIIILCNANKRKAKDKVRRASINRGYEPEYEMKNWHGYGPRSAGAAIMVEPYKKETRLGSSLSIGNGSVQPMSGDQDPILPPRTTTPKHPPPPSPSHAGSRPSTAMSRQGSHSSPQTNWTQFQSRPLSSQSVPHMSSAVTLDMQVTPIPPMGEPMNRSSSRNSMKLNPLYDGSKVVAPAGFVEQYRGGGYRKMPVNLVRPDRGILFHKLLDMNINMQWTLKELREKLSKRFKTLPEVKGNHFVFVDNDLNDVVPHKENEFSVARIFKAYVKVKIVRGTDAWIHFCPCGSTASIWCQKCALRGYCSQPCREKDEKPHNAMCQPNLDLLRQSLMDIQKASGSE